MEIRWRRAEFVEFVELVEFIEIRDWRYDRDCWRLEICGDTVETHRDL